MTIEIADCLFLSRAMGAPVPAGKDPQKWTGVAMANGERRAAGIAHLGALLGQLPTAEDFERVPAETPKRSAYTVDPKVYAVSDGFHPAGAWLGEWRSVKGVAHYEGMCPCNNGKGFGDCHGAEAEE